MARSGCRFPRGAVTLTAKTVEKRAVKIAQAPRQNLDEKFQLVWTGSGQLEAENQNGAATLRAKNGPAQGSMSIELPRFTEQMISGQAKIEGSADEALVALQSFDAQGKQVGWQTLFDAKGAKMWTSFESKIAWPTGAARVAIVVLLKGDGALSARELATSAF